MTNDYNILLNKLDNFIRKYYKNQIIKGVIFSLIIYLFFYITVSVLEYFGHFSVVFRSLLFYTSLSLFLAVFVYYIVIPLLRMIRIGKFISHKQAARIISSHFTNIQDKLLNTLELAAIGTDTNVSQELVLASIDQRIKALKPIPFEAAINFRENFKYAKYLLAILLLFILIFAISPSVFTEGSYRIVKHSTYFAPVAPFEFILLNDSLFIQKGGNYEVKIEVRGEYVPNEVAINYGGNSFIMDKKSKTEFSYSFKNINNTIDLFFEAENYRSKSYTLAVLPSPLILNFALVIDAPAYTNEPDKTIDNVGDVTVPYGSRIVWKFVTANLDSLHFTFNDSINAKAKSNGDKYEYARIAYSTSDYTVSVFNKYFKNFDIVRYTISVIPDLYPTIQVNNLRDSVNFSVFYFRGAISDDYGFTKLTFNYCTDTITKKFTAIQVPITKNVTAQDYYYAFDFSTLNVRDQSVIEYYFEVFDNDGINGAKSAQSRKFEFKVPSAKEIAEFESQASKSIESNIDEAKKITEQLKQSIAKLQQSNTDNSVSDWEKSKMIKDIVQKQNKLDELLKQITEENKEKNNMMNSFNEQQEQILEKQKQIEELMDNMMTDELRQLIDEINKMQEEFDKENVNQLTDKLDKSYEDLEKQLDKNLELLKRYEVEERVTAAFEELKDLAEKHDKLADDVENKKASDEQLMEKQLEQEKDFKDLMKNYEETIEMNDKLEKPFELDKFEENKQEISEKFEQSKQEMTEGSKRKAAKSQKENSKNMKEMADQMEQMMAQSMMSQDAEDYDDLRQILDNLVEFSFDQEALMKAILQTNQRNPQFIEIVNSQKRLADDFEIIRDSLYALSKRTPMVNTVINQEITIITRNLEDVLVQFGENQVNRARTDQQLIMTSANNLALFLNESLNAMQEQMSGSSSSGDKKKNKKGKPNPGLPDLKQQQQSMKQQLEQMLQQMKEGKANWDKKGTNQRLTQMLAQQEIFQQMLNQLRNGKTLNPESQKMLNEIDKLSDQIERDIINKQITQTTLDRQKQIMTRLLEAETAENERETEKKRESKEAKDSKLRNPEELFKNEKVIRNMRENLSTTDLKMTNYYKNKYREYMLKLNEN